jgi:hypothetical protein
VDKIKIVYLLPLYFYLGHDMSATSFTLKKRYYREVYAYYLRPLEKSRYRGRCFFTLKRSLEIVINNYRQRSRQRVRSLSLSIIFNFGKNFLNVGSLALCLSMGTSPGAILHIVSISKRKFQHSPHPSSAPGQFLTLR